MKGDVEEEASRPRPLSGGIWTLFSWLRRTERSSSDESITSVGSDRTTASFDYLSPLHYKRDYSPLLIQQSPLTETYKKRVQDRNLRQQYDRDLTLRRKYGLYTEEDLGYDAFSLPPARLLKDPQTIQGRQRRATSESFIQPRAAYVPGKRRAPLPPNLINSASLPKNYKRKRPAPKPPVKIIDSNKENIEVKVEILKNKYLIQQHTLDHINMASGSKAEIKNKNDKEVKLRSEKGFLKQMFDNRKRNSAIDTSHIKVLPSISELDKQAAEIIQTNKLNARPQSLLSPPDLYWMCTSCLKKYSTTISSCVYCLNREKKTLQFDKQDVITTASNICTQTDRIISKSDLKNEIDEKKKLREMLKEMKDSLPKRHKYNEKYQKSNDITMPVTETPTLRIGSTLNGKKVSYNCSIKNQRKQDSEIDKKSYSNSGIICIPQPCSSKQMPTEIINSDTTSKSLSKTKSDNGEVSSSKTKTINVEETGSNKKNVIGNNITLSPQKITTLDKKQKIDSQNNAISLHPRIEKFKASESVLNKNITASENNRVFKISNDSHLLPIKENEISVKSIVTSRQTIENIRLGDVLSSSAVQKIENNNVITTNHKNINIGTPLKISSLLNPIYCPKYKSSSDNSKVNKDQAQSTKKEKLLENKPTQQTGGMTKLASTSKNESSPSKTVKKNEINDTLIPAQPTIETNYSDHHAQRRDLISQLEQSIAKGDEQAAAVAAAKLAKLKLACSVLSFSSQIVSRPLLAEIERNNGKISNKISDIITEKKDKPTSSVKINSENKGNVQSQAETLNQSITESKNKLLENRPMLSTKENIADIPVPSTSTHTQDQNIPVNVWIEDKEATRGPILLLVSKNSLVGDLKKHAEKSLGLQICLQRWIVGQTLCSDDNTPLLSLAGPDLTAPFYLYLVESEAIKGGIGGEISKRINNTTELNKIDRSDVYAGLVKLEQQALVQNNEEFECGVCIEQCPVGQGVVLRECIHTFCMECLADAVRHCQDPVVSCPEIACPGTLQEREIRALLTPEDYEKWLGRSLAAAESGTRNTFHCRTRDCSGWAFCEPGVRRFPCPVCKHTNCLPCQAVHEGQSCEQFQTKLRETVSTVETDQNDIGTQALLKSLIEKGEALECPECKAVITKKWGCDWIKCSACKTEICWITKGRRWGPGGKGDTSGGCRCGVDGKRCHPSCAYCH